MVDGKGDCDSTPDEPGTKAPDLLAHIRSGPDVELDLEPNPNSDNHDDGFLEEGNPPILLDDRGDE